MGRKIADRDAADVARALYETLKFFRESLLGQQLFKEMDDIERNATRRAMGGKTPQDQNAYLEARGEVRAVTTIRDLFDGVESQHQEALNFIAADDAKRNKEV